MEDRFISISAVYVEKLREYAKSMENLSKSLAEENAEYRRVLNVLLDYHKKHDASLYIVQAIKSVLGGRAAK